MFVEGKCGPEIVPSLVRAFERCGKKPRQLVVISFDYEVVKQVKARLPKIACFYLSSFERENKTGRLKRSAEDLITLAKAAHWGGLKVNVTGQ